MENYIDDNRWFAEIVKEYRRDNTSFHDLVILLNSGKTFTVEIKEDEYYWYSRTSNIGLDYLSSFRFKNSDLRNEWLSKSNYWIKPEEMNSFENDIIVSKYGKLITCDADFQLYIVFKDKSVVFSKLYSNTKMKEQGFVKYLKENYNLRINKKSDYGLEDSWDSAAYFVNPKKDSMLRELEVNNIVDFERSVR